MGDVADGTAPTGQVHPAGRNGLKAEDRPQQGGLAGAVHPDQPVDLSGSDREGDLAQDLAARQRDRQSVYHQRRAVGQTALFRAGVVPGPFHGPHSRTVEVPLTSAACKASTSASIHDW